MQVPPSKEALERWAAEYERELNTKTSQARRSRLRAKNTPVRVWLGGSKRAVNEQRFTIADLLRGDGFNVSCEEYSNPRELRDQFDVAIVLAVSEGTVAEALELAHLKNPSCHLLVYLPNTLADSYVYYALNRKAAVSRSSLFDLHELDAWGKTLPLLILEDVNNFRTDRSQEL